MRIIKEDLTGCINRNSSRSAGGQILSNQGTHQRNRDL